MKKLVSLVLVAALALSTAACGQGQNTTTTATTAAATDISAQTQPTSEPTNEPTTAPAPGASDASGSTDSPGAPGAEGTMGQTLLASFREIASGGTSDSPLDMAKALLENKVIEFEGFAEEASPGLLLGFDTEIEGFRAGATFGPIIGSIPFIGYVFELEEGRDAAAFTKTLQDHANLDWLVCVRADETVVEAVGSTVLFIMCRSNTR